MCPRPVPFTVQCSSLFAPFTSRLAGVGQFAGVKGAPVLAVFVEVFLRGSGAGAFKVISTATDTDEEFPVFVEGGAVGGEDDALPADQVFVAVSRLTCRLVPSAVWPVGDRVPAFALRPPLGTEGVGHVCENSPASPASVRPWVLPWLGAWSVVRFSLLLLRGVGQSRAAVFKPSPLVGERPLRL